MINLTFFSKLLLAIPGQGHHFSTCGKTNDACLDESKAFGDYQYFLSFGGDQYLDIPLSIDAVYGTRGMIVQICHFFSQVSYEVTGYAAMGNFIITSAPKFGTCLRAFKGVILE